MPTYTEQCTAAQAHLDAANNTHSKKRRDQSAREYELSQEKLKSVLDYDPITGIFTWKVRRYRKMPGDVAGTIQVIPRAKKATSTRSYVTIGVFGRRYYAHRLAFIWMKGSPASKHVDHKDGDGTNNRWTNLRDATPSQNLYNSKISNRNTSGLKGVSVGRYGFCAQIRVNGRNEYLGFYKTAEEAHAAYAEAAVKYVGTFARVA